MIERQCLGYKMFHIHHPGFPQDLDYLDAFYQLYSANDSFIASTFSQTRLQQCVV